MPDSVKLVECPRDAWQGLQGQIPAYIKTDYLKALISAGFKHIDAVSFVSPKAVPQMADSEEVLKELDPPDDVEIIGIVVNEKGAQRAIATGAVRTLGFRIRSRRLSCRTISTRRWKTPSTNWRRSTTRAKQAGLDTVVYISMAFGNPYGDPWNVGEVVDAVELLEAEGVRTISLADTVGLAGPSADSRIVRGGKFQSTTISRLDCICTAVPIRRWRRYWPRMMRVAGDSIPRLEDWADVRSRRMRWWGISRRKKWWRR